MKKLHGLAFQIVLAGAGIAFCAILGGIIAAIVGGFVDNSSLKQTAKGLVVYGVVAFVVVLVVGGIILRFLGDFTRKI